MTINLTVPQAPVTDEELDQMIWKLERDGMTPKMLSLMRELREVRRAVTPTDDERIMAIEGIAPPAPVVPDGYALVPIEPTEHMIVEGFESEPDEHFSEPEVWEEYAAMSGCQQAAHRAKLCWAAMLSVAPTAPEQENI